MAIKFKSLPEGSVGDRPIMSPRPKPSEEVPMTYSNQRRNAGRVAPAIALTLVIFGCAAQGNAALLSLSSGRPDIFSSFVVVDYDLVDATTGRFKAEGHVMSLDYPGGANPDYPSSSISGTFKIDILVNRSTGAFVPGGTLTIFGSIPTKGFNNTTLLSGNVTGFGFAPVAGSQRYEFRFGNLDGALKNDFNKIGSVGVILTSGTINFQGNFNTSFENQLLMPGYGVGSADVYAEVPEPGSVVLWSMMCLSCITVRRRVKSPWSKTVRCKK
jgi:hypothetical protein